MSQYNKNMSQYKTFRTRSMAHADDALLGSLSDSGSSPVRPFPPLSGLSPGSCSECHSRASDDGDDDGGRDDSIDDGRSGDRSSSPEFDFDDTAAATAASSSSGPSATASAARARAYQRGKEAARGSKDKTSLPTQGCASSACSARGGRRSQKELTCALQVPATHLLFLLRLIPGSIGGSSRLDDGATRKSVAL